MQKHTVTGKEIEDAPALLSETQTTNPTAEQLYAAGYRKINPFECPEGMVIIPGTEQTLFDDGEDAFFALHDVETPEEAEARQDALEAAQDAIRAQAAQTRVLGLCDAYGADVAILGRLLAGFGYTLPCDPAEVIASIKGGLATGAVDWELRTDADTLEQRYDALKKVMTDTEIAAVGVVLTGMQP